MATDEIDDRLGIPRDSNGDPIFLVLPPAIQARYDRRMKRCERAWQATRNPLAFAEATTWAYFYRQPHPAWLHEASWVLAIKRQGKTHATRALNAAVFLQRYQAVRDAHYKDGLSWEDAYDRAAERSASTSWKAEARTMKAAYIRVKKDLKSGRGGLYFTPKWHRDFMPKELRKKLNNASKRAGSR